MLLLFISTTSLVSTISDFPLAPSLKNIKLILNIKLVMKSRYQTGLSVTGFEKILSVKQIKISGLQCNKELN